VHQEESGLVVGVFAVHRADEGDIVNALGKVRKGVGDLDAAVAARLEFVGGGEECPRLFAVGDGES
jgi:hypothetical protein